MMVRGARSKGQDGDVMVSRMARGGSDAPEVIGIVLVRDDLDDEATTRPLCWKHGYDTIVVVRVEVGQRSSLQCRAVLATSVGHVGGKKDKHYRNGSDSASGSTCSGSEVS